MSIVGTVGIDMADREPWVRDGLCRQIGPMDDIFFPGQWCRGALAKSICASCPVQKKCLDYALENEEAWGVWGGTTPQERKKMRLAVAKKPFHTPTCTCTICVGRRAS